ncbi:MAG: peptidoglycan-associated lipoprotein [Betaproteobacteria bacterium RIFCSPLOWO2_02_FULL_67_19]|nr:MAG: peptidoglycan-associated lipoprotein [Betaproteobacteria bacterium RIFCSPLOWO2_02_FULL_67_19]
MRAICTALTIAALAACSSTPTSEQPPAGVEDRPPSATQPGAQTQGVQRPPVAGVDLTAGKKAAPSPLTDPGSILSRRSIYYDLDKYDIRDEFKPLVEAHARYLRDNRSAKMLIQGNTDERGSREYNLALGQRRAEGLKKMLMLLGAQEAQVEAVSLGEEKPRAEGQNETAWAQNRRSDILYAGEY